MIKKVDNKIFLLLVLVLFISVNYGFFINTYNLIKKDYPSRMISIYGDCSKEGYGFTKFVFEKYNLKHNLDSLNGQPETYANTNGFFYNKNKLGSDKFKILINYNKDISNNFEILEKNKNCYLIKKKND